jgi:hypothetical protein
VCDDIDTIRKGFKHVPTAFAKSAAEIASAAGIIAVAGKNQEVCPHSVTAPWACELRQHISVYKKAEPDFLGRPATNMHFLFMARAYTMSAKVARKLNS